MHIKKYILITIYSIIITTVIVSIIYLTTSNVGRQHIELIPDVLYTMNTDIVGAIKITGSVTPTQIYNGTFNTVLDILPLLLIIILLVVIIITAIFIEIFRKVNNKKKEKLINNLKENRELNIDTIEDEILIKEYKVLKKEIDYKIEDYRILNSYISHEQKNMLSVVKAKLNSIKDKEVIEDIDKLNESIEDILTMSTVNSTDLEEIDLPLTAATVCNKYAKIYKNIEFNFEEDKNLNILGKNIWIERLISNLVDNAIKFGNNKKIEINIKEKNKTIILEIKDNGIGIEKKHQEKIFENNYRINELKKDGYGIGLSLVKHVCDLCNAYIYIDSQKEKGTSFFISFSSLN